MFTTSFTESVILMLAGNIQYACQVFIRQTGNVAKEFGQLAKPVERHCATTFETGGFLSATGMKFESCREQSTCL